MPDWKLERVADRFQQAALDPLIWPDVLDELSMSVGAVGAVLLSPDRLLPGTPVSPDITDLNDDYYKNGWSACDLRYRGAHIAIQRGVVVDQDFTNLDEMRRSPYYREWLERHGCRFFAAIGTAYGKSSWFISIQRTIKQDLFDPDECRRLARLAKPLNDAVVLSAQFSHKRVIGMADSLQLARQAAVLLDERGRLIASNSLAEAYLRDCLDVQSGCLKFRDLRSQDRFNRLLAQALAKDLAEGPVPGVTTVRTGRDKPVAVRAVALRGWARYTFTNASILLLLGDAEPEPRDPQALIKEAFGLTTAEARLTQALRTGQSVAQAAAQFGIAYDTARSQLRSIFAKTETNRQGQLVAALSHLPM